jgi:hypothetical protein
MYSRFPKLDNIGRRRFQYRAPKGEDFPRSHTGKDRQAADNPLANIQDGKKQPYLMLGTWGRFASLGMNSNSAGLRCRYPSETAIRTTTPRDGEPLPVPAEIR